MSIWNKTLTKTLAALSISACLALPAFADGTPGKPVNRGPEPVQPHQPAPVAPPPTMKQTSTGPCCGTFTRTIVKEHPPVVTKRTVTHRSAPTVTRRASTVTRTTAPASTEVKLDMAGFTGGVGSGIGGGYYGGGGAIILTSGKRFSGVLSHGASAFTFRSGGHYRGGGMKRGGGGCGC